MTKEQKNEVATTSGALVSGSLLEQLGSLSHDGFENVTAQDMAQSIIRILQSNSPECEKKSQEYLPHVSEGQLFDSSTKIGYDELEVVPIGFTKTYIEWVPREKGGGMAGRYAEGHPRIREAQQVGYKLVFDNGNNLVETAEHHVLVLHKDKLPSLAVIPLSSTQLKHSRRWVSTMASQVAQTPEGPKRLPMFFQKYKLATSVESNAKGSWYGLGTIEYLGVVSEDLLSTVVQMADAFNAATQGGKNTAAFDTAVNIDAGNSSPQVVDISASME